MHGYSILLISSFYVPSVKNNFGTTGLTEAGKAKAWGSKISTYNVLTIFSTFLINSTCRLILNLNIITKRFNEKNCIGMVQKLQFSFCCCLQHCSMLTIRRVWETIWVYHRVR